MLCHLPTKVVEIVVTNEPWIIIYLIFLSGAKNNIQNNSGSLPTHIIIRAQIDIKNK